jgi:hypothetical protein
MNNTPVETVLRKYLDASVEVLRITEESQEKLRSLNGPGGIDPVKWNATIKADEDAMANCMAERNYYWLALMAWHADPSIDLMLWKLQNPKP